MEIDKDVYIMYKRFYVLSTGRCGTRFLSEVFNAVSNRNDNLHQDKYSKILNIIGNLALKSGKFQGYLLNLIQYINDGEIPYSTVDPLKSISYTLFFKERLFDKNIVIVHLVRDPRDFVTSFMNWKNRKLSGLIAHHLAPYWMPPTYLDEDISFFRSITISKFEHFCWIWNYKNRLFRNQFQNHPNYYVYKFEDIISNIDVLNSLLHVCDIEGKVSNDIYDEKINKSPNKYFPKWNNWQNDRAIILHNHCGKLMQSYGYGLEKEWKEKIY